MCGRFTLKTDPETLTETFPGFTTPAPDETRLPVTISLPLRQIAVVPNNGENSVEFFQWGLIPSWAKDPKIGNRMINARSETLAEKPSFRTPYKRRRCLILSDGFYEWRRLNRRASPKPLSISDSNLRNRLPSLGYGKRGIRVKMTNPCSPVQSSRPPRTRSWNPFTGGCRSSLNPILTIYG